MSAGECRGGNAIEDCRLFFFPTSHGSKPPSVKSKSALLIRPIMSPESAVEFALIAYDGTPTSTGAMTVIVDATGIAWTSLKTSGCVGYDDITSISLILGDPDPDERDDYCLIHKASGLALKVYCDGGKSFADRKLYLLRRQAYSNFILLLHSRLSVDNRNRIEFKTDGKLTRKAQLFLVWGWAVSSVAVIALLITLGHPMALGFCYMFFLLVYGVAIFSLIPKEPRTYTPDPIDEMFLPR